MIQIVQMVFGLWIVLIATSGRPGCTEWMEKEPLGARGCLVMYASYLVLFAKLFIDNYILNLKKKKVEHSKGQ